MPQDTDVTRLRLAWSEGRQEAAAAPLMDAVYEELRRLARGYLVRERRDHSLPATALVHEAYLKLIDQRRVRWQNRAHFFAVAAQVMRRLLVDHARARGATKRGAEITIPLDGVDVAAGGKSADLMALDTALDKLATLDPRQARLVELRYFGAIGPSSLAFELSGVRPFTGLPNYVVTRAGDRVLAAKILREATGAHEIQVMVNWRERLRHRVPMR